MSVRYRIPAGIHAKTLCGRPLISTREGGQIAVDQSLQDFWLRSNNHTLAEIITGNCSAATPEIALRAALACLCGAGLLERVDDSLIQEEILAEPAPANIHSSISVIIVNYNSRDWLEACLPFLQSQTLPPTEIIVVDNNSTEDPDSWLIEHYPNVIRQRLSESQSLAAALNRGVELASGDYFLLLNPDTRLTPDALAQMLSTAQNDPACGAVAPTLRFNWAPAFLNGLGNYAGAFSWGVDHALGHLDLGQFEGISELPSACFAATLIPSFTWDAVGPLDEGFPLYYEDIEWSYRARSFGYRILAAPKAVVYHAFGRRIHDGKDIDLSPAKLANVTYGRLRFATKILTGWRSAGYKLSYALDDLIRAFLSLFTGKLGTLRAYAQGWMSYWQTRTQIHQQKMAIMPRRVVGDRELLAQQKNLPDPFIWRGLPELTWDSVVFHYLPLIQSGRTRSLPEFETVRPKLLIVSNEIIDIKMAGPGMRYLEIARALCDEVDITLAIPGETTLDEQGMRFVTYTETHTSDLRALVEAHDIALITAFTLNKFPFLGQVNTPLVVDLYDPFIFENLFYYLDEPFSMQADINRQSVDLLNRVARLGDFFICGSERQRDLWIGLLVANQRVNPYTFDQDMSLRRLIDVVGIGFPNREPIQHPFLRGSRPEFPQDCRIILWGGGVWDWLDPLTLVQAWPQVIADHPEARLVFLGTRHPNPDVPQHRVVNKLESFAEKIGEKDRTVFFIEWLSYADREALLSEADIGVTLHTIHVETHFSIRTRVLDYIWARLPILISEGDVTSEWVHEYALGRVVRHLDPDAVAQAIAEILSVPKSSWYPQFDRIRDRFRWPEVVEPLRQYCLHLSPAADRQSIGQRTNEVKGLTIWRSRLARARYIWRNQGGKAVFIRIGRNIRKYLTKLF